MRLPMVSAVAALAACIVVACAEQRGEGGVGRPQPESSRPTSATEGRRGPGVPAFWVRPGYRVDLLAEGLEEARFLEFDDKGNLYVSQPGRGAIVTMRLRGGKYERVADFVTGKRTVHGLCWADGWLWFTQTGSIHRGRDTTGDGKADDIEAILAEGSLPRGGGHWWRSILVTRDALFTSIGDSGNISDETETDRQKIWRFAKDGTGKKLWSSGIRNTEKLRLRPGTSEVWGFDHGSDWFGGPLGERESKQPITDYNPPEELNHYVEGGFYGHPFVVGVRVPRIEFHGRADIVDLAAKTIPPAWCLGAHWAVNGFTFLGPKNALGADHEGDVVAACHGSWNRSTPAGYRVERVLFDRVTGRPYGSLCLVSTLGPDNRVLARPVDCVEAPDGSLVWCCNTTRRLFRLAADKP